LGNWAVSVIRFKEGHFLLNLPIMNHTAKSMGPNFLVTFPPLQFSQSVVSEETEDNG
jgi:hypothetical protein